MEGLDVLRDQVAAQVLVLVLRLELQDPLRVQEVLEVLEVWEEFELGEVEEQM